ncbi:CCC motif membrane protein [Aurantibacter sp.]|uniref:CCC motif membrane protein n=1 Tax=Aurantibacter sp. TaxID=2807103 RepID=UPI0035C7A641
MKKSLSPTLIYVLAILGLLCCCFGGAGLFLSAPAYFMANSKLKDVQLNPDSYEGKLSAMETAKIIALVITIINVLYLAYTIYTVSTVGFDQIQEQYQNAIEQYQQAQ